MARATAGGITRSWVPSTVPEEAEDQQHRQPAPCARSPVLRPTCSASITMFGTINSATAVFTSMTSASSGVATVGKPKPIAPLTKAARGRSREGEAAARRR